MKIEAPCHRARKICFLTYVIEHDTYACVHCGQLFEVDDDPADKAILAISHDDPSLIKTTRVHG
jgi:Fe2+ or Zn2+ uptake regulation protein